MSCNENTNIIESLQEEISNRDELIQELENKLTYETNLRNNGGSHVRVLRMVSGHGNRDLTEIRRSGRADRGDRPG